MHSCSQRGIQVFNIALGDAKFTHIYCFYKSRALISSHIGDCRINNPQLCIIVVIISKTSPICLISLYSRTGLESDNCRCKHSVCAICDCKHSTIVFCFIIVKCGPSCSKSNFIDRINSSTVECIIISNL